MKNNPNHINQFEMLFNNLFNETSDVVFVFFLDESGFPAKFININKGALSLLEYPARELYEMNLMDIVDATSRLDILSLKDILGEQQLLNLEIGLIKRSKSIVKVDFRVISIVYNNQHAFLMIGTNNSDQKSLQAKLSQIEKLEAVGQLAGGIAHDFNNVLAGISGLAELALRKIPASHEAAHSIKTIYQKANNSANMVKQLVAFSRKQKLTTKATNLNNIIKSNRKLLQRYLGEDINFTLKLDPQLHIIKSDHASIDQIITNLCINARDAMPDGGDLEIATQNVTLKKERVTTSGVLKPGKYILLSVYDNGLGMSEETLEHIFEPFYTTKDIGYGTGLGLSIVYGLIKQHNALIDCQSAPGEGTRFSIYFPWYARTEEQDEKKESHKDLSGSETVLIAEDEADIILYLKESLELYGYKVLVAHNGKKALDIFQKEMDNIRMIISDVVMPEMGGLELKLMIDTIKKNTKFLLISAYTNRLEPGIPFLQKPFSTEELVSAVRHILDETYLIEE
jgi:signal transduction histidine kinase